MSGYFKVRFDAKKMAFPPLRVLKETTTEILDFLADMQAAQERPHISYYNILVIITYSLLSTEILDFSERRCRHRGATFWLILGWRKYYLSSLELLQIWVFAKVVKTMWNRVFVAGAFQRCAVCLVWTMSHQLTFAPQTSMLVDKTTTVSGYR